MTRTILIALTVLIAAASAADDAVPPRFFIERIEVREADRVSPDVVIAESRLREGQEYTEADLRDAATRLSRLPFLLSTDFALEKGSERGRYVLVLTIAETKSFFYAIDFRPILTPGTGVEADYSDRIGAEEGTGTLGMRWFLGRRGALHLALVTTEYDRGFARDYGAVAVGYTQYDLFGTRAFATFSIKQVVADEAGGSLSPQLVVGVPLSANQTLTVELDETSFGTGVETVSGEDIPVQRSQRIVGATWSYNTTNRPFLPTRGTLLSVRPRASWGDSATFVFLFDPAAPEDLGAVADTVHTRALELTVKGAHYWEVSERTSLSAGAEGAWTQFNAESEVYGEASDHVVRAVLIGGYSYSLWDATRMKTGDSRLELNARIGSRSIDYYNLGRKHQQQVSASWVRRSSWGTLRLGAGYAW